MVVVFPDIDTFTFCMFDLHLSSTCWW